MTTARADERPFAESRFDTVDNVVLHYRLWPVPPAELKGNVLLIHGFAGSTYSWRLCAAPLQAAGYRVVAVDLPGYGYSDRRTGGDNSQPGRARLLWQLLDLVDMKHGPPCRPVRWVLAGHSMGGGTVVAMARQRPERSAALVLVDAAVSEPSPGAGRVLLRRGPVRRAVRAGLERALSQHQTLARMLKSAYGRAPDSLEVEGYRRPLLLPGTVDALLDALVRAPSPTRPDLSGIDCPVLIVWGEKDGWVGLEQGRRLHREIAGSELVVIPGAGHLPMETAPESFNPVLLEFLTRVADR